MSIFIEKGLKNAGQSIKSCSVIFVMKPEG